MLVTLLLLGMLAQSGSEAVDLENAGRYEEALKAYQRQAADDPNDHQVRLAIGRIHLRLRHPDRAEPVFRSVALEDGNSLPALLGLADALFAQWRAEEALEVLERAEALSATDPGVLSRLGRAHQDTGHSTQAVAYLQRAAATSTSPEHRRSLERARLVHDHRIALRSFAEQFSGSAPDSRNADLTVDYRLDDRLRVVGRGEYQRKFLTSDARGGLGLAWRRTPATTVGVQVLIGPGNKVMPQGDYSVQVDHTYGVTSWMGDVRYFDFDGARVTTVSPGVAWRATDRLSVGLRYALSLTDVASRSSWETGHTGQFSASLQAGPRVWLQAGYARGVEDFEHFSIDRAGAFTAHTGSAGVRLDLRSLTSLTTTYEHQSREHGVKMGRLTVSLAQRF